MSTLRIIGTSFGSGVLQAKDKFKEAVNGSMTISRTFRAFKTGWITDCPARGSAHPDYASAILTERNADPSDIPGLVDVTLTYVSPATTATYPGGGTTPLPPTEYSETANSVEAPIEAHPDFATFGTVANGAIFNTDGTFKGWEKTSEFAGYMTFKVPSITESTTVYFWTQPASVSTLIGGVEGEYWLVVGGSIQRRYPYWTRTLNRIWSEIPLNTTIYTH